MNNKRKILAGIIAISLIAGAVPSVPLRTADAAAGPSLDAGSILDVNGLRFEYRTLEDDTLEIVRYISTKSDNIIVPSQADDKKITSIGDRAFYGNDDIASVTISAGITKIGMYAFADCPNITEIMIPSSVNEIGDCAFASMKSLQSVNVSSSNKSFAAVDDVLFSKDMTCLYTYPMTKPDSYYTVPDTVTKIACGAFFGCSYLVEATLPDCLEVIGARAFAYCTGMGSVILPESVGEVQYGAFAGITELSARVLNDACLFGTGEGSVPVFDETAVLSGYRGSTAEACAEECGCKFNAMFTWGKDNFGFSDSSEYFSGNYRAMISKGYLDTLKSNLNNTEYARIFRSRESMDGRKSESALDRSWESSSFGMAAVTALVRLGAIDVSKLGKDAVCINELDAPGANSDISSIITYYCLLNDKDYFVQERQRRSRLSHKENITNILFAINSDDGAVVGYSSKNGSRALYAYDYGYGTFDLGEYGRYTGCVYVYDPGSPEGYDPGSNIYFRDSEDGSGMQWVIPRYAGAGSEECAYFDTVLSGTDELDQGGYFSGAPDKTCNDRKTWLRVSTLLGGSTILDHKTTASSVISTGNEAVHDVWYAVDSPLSAFTVTQPKAAEIALAVDYPDCTMTGSAELGRSVYFDPDGVIRMEGSRGAYEMSMVTNGKHPMEWFGIEVKGEGAENASLKKDKTGYVFEADVLAEVSVLMYNKNDSVELSFSTEYDKVKIYEIDEYHIGAAADSDGDGVYETVIAMTEDMPGDIDGDRKVTAADASLVLTEYADVTAGQGTFTAKQKKAADVNRDGKIAADDASLILTFYAYKSGGGEINNITEFIKSLN